MGIADWLTGWFAQVAGGIGQAVSDAIHWAVHALAVVMLAVFDTVFGAWRGLAGWTLGFFLTYERALFWVGAKIWHIIRVAVPALYRFIRGWVAYLLKFIRSWVAWLWNQIRATIALLYRQIAMVIRWATTHIWDPLWRWAQFLYHLIRAWAWVAFWWITHLASLAEAMIFHIAASVERNAWQIAPLLGRFLLALILRNLRRFVQLMEQILTAVI